MNQVDAIEIKKLVAKIAVSYYHWRVDGFPEDHAYHMHVALFDSYISSVK